MIRAASRLHKGRQSHTDDWLMTYADLITLLLCFFALFLSISMPRMYAKIHDPVANKPMMPQLDQPDIKRQAEPMMRVRDMPYVEPVVREVKVIERVPVSVAAAPAPTVPELQGDRINIIEVSSAAVFPLGSATLSEEGKAMLATIAGNLRDEKFHDYQVTVEGHTDDNPVETPQFPSNWELSTARAAAVVRYFIEQGVPAQKLRAAGYADSQPKMPNRDATGQPIEAHQAENRRVVIKLEKIEKVGQ